MTLKLRVLLIFSIVFTLSHTLFAQSQPLFSVTSFQDIGAQQVMATGDFNGDGQPDLATISANSASSTLTILLEQDNATPPIAKTTSLGISVTRLVAVDMNKDKELDLVAVCTSSGSTGIAVLLGNGDGTFQAPVFYPITGVQNLTATDLNGDGYPDIAAISSSNLFVLLNEGLVGPGTLSAPASYLDAIGPSPSGPLNIGSGDFNGDGKQDIIIGGDLIAVLFGNGDGTLQAQQSVSPGTSGNCFATVDVNHDGITDIVYIAPDPTDPTSLYVSVYLGHSNGTFSSYESVGLDLSSSYPIALVPAGTSNNGNDVLFAAVSDKTMILDASGILAQSISYAVNGTPFPVLNSSGKTDLVFDLTGTSAGSTDNKILRVRGNGDGTFTGASNSFDAGPFGFVAADFNNDGLTDIVTVNSTNSMITGLGRGNGTFSISSSFPNAPGKLLVAADFDHDGNQDIAAILAFSGQDSLLYFYKGLGDGSFRVPDGASYVNLHVPGAVSAIAGDFNGDGTADIIVSYSNSTSQGLVFVPGKGDGTFGTPVSFSSQPLSVPAPAPLLLAADLNNDHKLDLLWNGNTYLGNGDGTFKENATALPGPVLAVGDLNGDGIPDVVIGTSVYAGNGDVTFQSSPFYIAPVPASTTVTLANISDSNADGHPDLLLQYQINGTGGNNYLGVYLGDGTGNFAADTNSYYLGGPATGASSHPPVGSIAILVRLNSQAPLPAQDHALDYLTWTSGGATALLNLTNPVPAAASPVPSKTSMYPNFSKVAPGEPVIFNIKVNGLAPSGSITLTSGGKILGTSPLAPNGFAMPQIPFAAEGIHIVTATYSGDSNNQPSSGSTSVTVAKAVTNLNLSASGFSSALMAGATQQVSFGVNLGGYDPTGTVTFSVAGGSTIGTPIILSDASTLNYAFPGVGDYVVTASYAGDAANLPSTSNSVTVTVVPQDFTFTAPGNYASISAGQAVGATLTVAATQYGFGTPVTFSCSGLATGERCTFAPSTLTLQNTGYARATTQLIIFTTGPTSTASLRRLDAPLEGAVWAGLLCLLFLPRRMRRIRHLRLLQQLLLAISLAGALIHITACSSGGGQGQSGITPSGTQTITITAAAQSGSQSHSLTIQLNIK